MTIDSQLNEQAPANGAVADKPLTTSVEKLGLLDHDKLKNLILADMLDEPAQAVEPEKNPELPSEEIAADAEVPEDTALSKTTEKEDTPEETPEATAEEVKSEDGLPKGAQKRIDKLTARSKEAEAKSLQLEQELVNLRMQLNDKASVKADAPIVSSKDNPYLHLTTQGEVEAQIIEARKVRRWAEENPDGTTVRSPDGKEIEYSSEEVRSIKLNAMDAIEDHLPKQLAYVRTRSQIDPMAEAEYTWWKDRSSREFNSAQAMLKAFPELQKFPDYKMVVGDYLRGAAARESNFAQRNTAQKAAVKKAPIQPTKSTPAPPAATANERNIKTSYEAFRKNANSSTLKDIVLNQFL